MSGYHYEAFASAAIEQAAHEKRAQPWKNTVDIQKTPSIEEWVDVASVRTSNSQDVDICKQAFPMGAVHTRGTALLVVGMSAVPLSGGIQYLVTVFKSIL
ncbi:hypothetical protein VPNG_07666 [Cytospora leucostoma]|uniref:Uncharacterized protein n=1 Tax=Cytospora leucostoma TaxID=1230097 RepID=A0A423WF89_9PEZI|nr:hypothetical protein VPNG_07666 [Cytospora leucostoma]